MGRHAIGIRANLIVITINFMVIHLVAIWVNLVVITIN